MSADLTWQQRQVKALGLPFEGAQPPALLIALHDAANPDSGIEQHALYAPVTSHTETAVDDYIKRIATIIRRNNMFDALERPVLKITCVPSLSVSGNFCADEKIITREIDWLEYDRTHKAELAISPNLTVRIMLPANE